MNIAISKAILHIVDASVGVPVISDRLMSLSDEMRKYIEKHVSKCYHDPDLKKVRVINENGSFFQLMQKYRKEHNFKEASAQIAKKMYDLAFENPDIPSCDMLFIDADILGQEYFILLKLNYTKGYIHLTKDEEGRKNIIVEHSSILPGANQKVDEAIFIDMSKSEIWIKEKKCFVYDVPCYYMSKYIVECREEKRDGDKIKIILNAVDKIIGEYYEDDVYMKARARSIVKEGAEAYNIKTEKVADILPDRETKDFFNKIIKDKGISEPIVNIGVNCLKKIETKQKIVADNGIEINIPYELLDDRNKVDFITNQNGTMTVMLKDIERLI